MQLASRKEKHALLVETAGKIIMQDICSKTFNSDYYPTIDHFLADADCLVLGKLHLLLNTVILTNK